MIKNYFATMLFCSCVILAGCNKPSFTGVFRLKKGENISTYDFRNDGTVTYESFFYLPGEDSSSYSHGEGKYVIRGGQVIADMIRHPSPKLYDGTVTNRLVFNRESQDLLLASSTSIGENETKYAIPERYVKEK